MHNGRLILLSYWIKNINATHFFSDYNTFIPHPSLPTYTAQWTTHRQPHRQFIYLTNYCFLEFSTFPFLTASCRCAVECFLRIRVQQFDNFKRVSMVAVLPNVVPRLHNLPLHIPYSQPSWNRPFSVHRLRSALSQRRPKLAGRVRIYVLSTGSFSFTISKILSRSLTLLSYL